MLEWFPVAHHEAVAAMVEKRVVDTHDPNHAILRLKIVGDGKLEALRKSVLDVIVVAANVNEEVISWAF